MGKRRKAPAGLDYVPIPGRDQNFVFGVVRSKLDGKTNTATWSIMKRLFPVPPVMADDGRTLIPTCRRYDVTLPPWAPSDYMQPLVLTRAYDDLTWEGMKDLVVMMNFRFPEAVSSPPTMTLHAIFELVRGFAYQRLSLDRDMATVIALHVPTQAGQQGVPHCHLMGLARRCGPTSFGEFVRPLATDAGREIIEREWHEWRVANGMPWDVPSNPE